MSEQLSSQPQSLQDMRSANMLARYMLDVASQSVGAIAQNLQGEQPEPTSVVRGEYELQPYSLSAISSPKQTGKGNQIQLIYGNCRYIWDTDSSNDPSNQYKICSSSELGREVIMSTKQFSSDDIANIKRVVRGIFNIYLEEELEVTDGKRQ